MASEPKPRKGLGRRRMLVPISALIPNMMTVAAICAGLTAIRFSFEGHFVTSVQLILAASVLDGLDGRLARMLKSESAIGAELDSLADFLNFGVAPALMVFVWSMAEIRDEGWIAVVIYTLCCVMRLARFNVGMKAPPTDASKRFFTGVPAPAGAFLAMLPMFLAFGFPALPVLPADVIAVWLVVVGLLMISRIPTFSLKSVAIYRDNAAPFLIGCVAVLAALLSVPWITFAALDLAYLAGMVWSWRVARRMALRQSS